MFRFKQFIVDDSACAMKVGTDGVLLGSWAKLSSDSNPYILDIGTGSGLIALMLSQRFSNAHITAIDIDPQATLSAEQNFSKSKWHNRLTAHNCSLQQFANINTQKYALIVSNPPYFENALQNPDPLKANARHTNTLTYQELIALSSNMLTQNGSLALILPADQEKHIISLARHYNLYPYRICYVKGRAEKPAKRILIQMLSSNSVQTIEKTSLILMDEAQKRTSEYSHLTQDFYL